MARVLSDNPETGETFELVNGEWQPVYADTDQSIGETLLIGAGRNFTQLGRGVQNLLGLVSEEDQARFAGESELYGELQRERPIATAAGEILPGLAIGGGASLLGRGVGTGLAAAIGREGAIEGVLGASEYRPEVEDQLIGGAIGAGLGSAGALGGDLIARGAQARRAARSANQRLRDVVESGRAEVAGRLTPGEPSVEQAREVTAAVERQLSAGGRVADEAGEHGRLVSRARELGITLSPGEVLDDPTLRQMEASLSSNPVTSALGQARKRGNQKKVNEIFNRALGLGDADEITQESFGRIFNDLDDEFKAVSREIGVFEFDEELQQGLQAIQNSAASSPVRAPELNRILKNMTELFEAGDNAIGGGDLIEWRSQLNQRMRDAARNGEGNLSARLRDVIREIDDGVIRQGGEDLGERYAQARARYRLADALESSGAVKNGNVQPGRAANAMSKRYLAEFARGNQYQQAMPPELLDAFDALRISNRYKDIVGDSGTATRLSMQNLLRNPVTTTLEATAGLGLNAVGRGVARPGVQAGARALTEQTDSALGGILARILGGGGREAYRENQ